MKSEVIIGIVLTVLLTGTLTLTFSIQQTRAIGRWNTTKVDSAGEVGDHTSIALDSGDKPHISYLDYSNWHLKYAYYDGVNWHNETVESAGYVQGYTSIALDSGDRPHISYSDEGNRDLKYAYYDGVNWVKETVDSYGKVGRDTSIALDSGDRPHISYSDEGNSDLEYAYYDARAVPVDKLGLLAPYIALAIAIIVATVATAILVKHRKKQ